MLEENSVQTAKADRGGDKNLYARPAITLPKGGGAIQGIGEKFSVNPVNGTAAITVPIFTTPCRSGFGPELSLSYDSGAGNGPFGFGWHLSVPSITRKTDKGLPRYFDADESDVFILSEAEDLVPVLVKPGSDWIKDISSGTLGGQSYTIQRYRPRIEGLFARIERWRNDATGDTFWKSISRDNVASIYGSDDSSRIADPSDPTHVITWLLSYTYDDRGNIAAYKYKSEDNTKVSSALHEQHRQVSANRYLKRIKYGNPKPYDPVSDASFPTKWFFEVVFDYGEHDPLVPTPLEVNPWRCRPDPFSKYRSGFEVRTFRLCSRILMFHHFPTELGTPNYLVRSTDFTYSCDTQPSDPLNPIYTFLESIEQIGYVKDGDGYLSRGMPPIEFTYSKVEIDETLHLPDSSSMENLPYGVGGKNYLWVDLDSEGSPGILTEQANGWFYKRNVSNLPASDGTVSAKFEPDVLVVPKPSLAEIGSGGQQLMDLKGDGELSLVQFNRPVSGFYERGDNRRWKSFTPFNFSPNIDWSDPNLRTVDLDGDGFVDVLITEDDVFKWYPSLAKDGFGPAETVVRPSDEETGPALVFADPIQTIYLADMSGDGLQDIVRVRNGEVCYWPNVGYGNFGAKITMDASPVFDAPDLFDEKRIRLADIDGSGTTDIIYLGRDKITLWFNQSGNSWSPQQEIPQFPPTDNLESVNVVDLLGNGTSCLVWSSPLPGDSRQPMRDIDLMGGQKPHLLIGIKNNLGAETQIKYAASTQFYLADREAGQPWITRLSFPVHVVERVETYDWVSRNRFASRYTYHHGYYDGLEREFRGFGMVEQQDTEEIGALTSSGDFPSATNIDAASYVPPTLTKTWYHTGVYPRGGRVSRLFEEEYYRESDLSEGVAGLTDTEFDAMQLPDTVIPEGLMADEIHEAIRSLKGSVLRQEVFALDGTDESDRPYTVTEKNYTIRMLQPLDGNRHAVFLTHACETIDFQYERKRYNAGTKRLADPRVTHAMVLSFDDYGNEEQSVKICYGRRRDDPDSILTTNDHTEQKAVHVTYTESDYTNPVSETNAYRIPLSSEVRTFELIKIVPDNSLPDITNLFGFDEMTNKVAQASDGSHDLPFEDINAIGAVSNHPYRRLIADTRTFYRKNDFTGPLALGVLESMALPYQNYKLAFTSGLLTVYMRTPPLQPAQDLIPSPTAVFPTDGGYVDLDGNGNWWIPSGLIFYSPNQSDTPTAELANASAHFFLPRRFEDPFGNNSFIQYDTYDLLLLETEDALQNLVTVGERDSSNNITSRNDYRVMKPSLLTDPNGNRSAVAFDALGLVVGTAVMGKAPPAATGGDSLTGFVADLAQSDIDQFFSNPAAPYTLTLLASATTRIIYDINRFYQTSIANPNDPTKWLPAFAATVARETHVSDLVQNGQTKVQIKFIYSDGLDRVIQHKAQAEPGPLVEGGTSVDPRWVGSGWTIFNNKGKPIRKYEPFFDSTHDFKFGLAIGVSPVLFYDPLGRIVAKLNPNQSWEKIIFDPWYEETWDVNDTVAIADPSTDSDVDSFFQRIPGTDYLPTWYTQRSGGLLGPEEQDAATKAMAHANTPMVVFLDSLGRKFLTVADNALSGKITTHNEFDIQQNVRSITDGLQRQVMSYDYDMLKTQIHSDSADAGERWSLNDVVGKPIRAWDSRGHEMQIEYDVLRRPIHRFVSGTDATNSDPRTLGKKVLFEQIIYGEGQTNDQALNLRTRVYQMYDGAGVITNEDLNPDTNSNEAYDFKGNLLRSNRKVADDYKKLYDWAVDAVQSTWNTYSSSTHYDALNRPIALTTPDASVIQPTYNEANLLAQLSVNFQGATMATAFVTNIDYNAKGQRTLIQYGNGASTSYEYDPETFRLIKLKTTRTSDNAVLQDLRYTYDPIGNVTQFEDNAQQTIYFNNTVVSPNCNYTYDAIYRLITAAGRENIGQAVDPRPEYDWNDFPRINLPHPNDGNAMRQYQEQYIYDNVGNILQMVHQATGGNWTRNYGYASNCNQLQGTSLPGDPPLGPYSAKYSYDLNGGMIQMLHLPAVKWDFKEQLYSTQQQVVNDATGETTFYVYDFAGTRVRKVTESSNGVKIKERIYLGGFEIYREYTGSYAGLERQTLHVMDDKQRIAMIETRNSVDDGTAQKLTRYQFSNNLGSACLELDDSAQAQVISYEEYYPYGGTSYQAMNQSINAAAKRYRYTGKERDEENGFYYHGARYYAPWLGRWISCDPMGVKDGVNLYRYVRNNPIKLVDPQGTQSKPGDPTQLKLSEPGLLHPASAEERLANRIAQRLFPDLKLNLDNPGTTGSGGTSSGKGFAVDPQVFEGLRVKAYEGTLSEGEKELFIRQLEARGELNPWAHDLQPAPYEPPELPLPSFTFFDWYFFGGTTYTPGKPLSLSTTLSYRKSGWFTGNARSWGNFGFITPTATVGLGFPLANSPVTYQAGGSANLLRFNFGPVDIVTGSRAVSITAGGQFAVKGPIDQITSGSSSASTTFTGGPSAAVEWRATSQLSVYFTTSYLFSDTLIHGTSPSSSTSPWNFGLGIRGYFDLSNLFGHHSSTDLGPSESPSIFNILGLPNPGQPWTSQ